jgi:hypothetical protein
MAAENVSPQIAIAEAIHLLQTFRGNGASSQAARQCQRYMNTYLQAVTPAKSKRSGASLDCRNQTDPHRKPESLQVLEKHRPPLTG